jgi:hypothetical protein
MRVTKPIVLGAAAVFGLGLTTAVAADTHGDAVSAAASAAKALVGEARGDAVSLIANANGKARSAAAAANSKNATTATNGDTQGDAVSAIAKNRDLTAAHTTGAQKVNHGGAVSAAADKR